MSANKRTVSHYRDTAVLMLVPGFVAIMLQPWARPPSLHAFDFQRWAEVGGLSVLAMLLMPSVGALLHRRPWATFFLVCFTILLCVSAWFSGAPTFLWASVARTVLYSIVILGFTFTWQRSDDRQRVWFAVLLITAMSIYCLYSMVGALSLLASGVYDRTVMVFGFSNVNHAAGFIMLSLLLLPGLAGLLRSHGRKFAMVAQAVGITLVFMLAVIASRGAFLACFVVGGVLMFFHREEAVDRYLRWLLGAFATGLLVYLVFTIIAIGLDIDLWIADKGLIADSGRFQLYQTALTGALDAPWTGHGPLSYAALPAITLGHAHNTFLTLLYEFGLPLTLYVIASCLIAWRAIWKARTSITQNPVAVAGLAGLLGFAVHAQFSGLLMIPATMFMALVAGAFITDAILMPTSIIRAPNWGIPATILGAMLVTAYLFLTIQYWQAADSDVSQKPRFWLHGGTEVWFP